MRNSKFLHKSQKKTFFTKRTLVGKGMVHFDEIDFVFGTRVVDDYIYGAKSLYIYEASRAIKSQPPF